MSAERVPASQVLAEADWSMSDHTSRLLVGRVGFDMADEIVAELEDVSAAILGALGERPLSRDTATLLMKAVAGVVCDGHDLT